jgi:GH25 family lysozyme M1 (1,4-beta-N-acetylmuramidase)
MRFLPILATLALPIIFSGCGNYGHVSFKAAPKIVNVSSWDPKEHQRSGESYSSHDVSALRRNGALGLIARSGKGMTVDIKCAEFLNAANREGLMLGTYYFVLKSHSAVAQADDYINHLRQISPRRRVLLVGDFDTKSSAQDLVAFINRVEQLTGVLPVIYLENSDRLRNTLCCATTSQKSRIRQCPYWLALYAPHTGLENPKKLTKAYGIWDDWSLWQYAGVEWHGRSISRHYHHGPWKSPTYFGNLDRPLEHNAFNGSVDQLNQFWAKHSWLVQ